MRSGMVGSLVGFGVALPGAAGEAVCRIGRCTVNQYAPIVRVRAICVNCCPLACGSRAGGVTNLGRIMMPRIVPASTAPAIRRGEFALETTTPTFEQSKRIHRPWRSYPVGARTLDAGLRESPCSLTLATPLCGHGHTRRRARCDD